MLRRPSCERVASAGRGRTACAIAQWVPPLLRRGPHKRAVLIGWGLGCAAHSAGRRRREAVATRGRQSKLGAVAYRHGGPYLRRPGWPLPDAVACPRVPLAACAARPLRGRANRVRFGAWVGASGARGRGCGRFVASGRGAANLGALPPAPRQGKSAAPSRACALQDAALSRHGQGIFPSTYSIPQQP